MAERKPFLLRLAPEVHDALQKWAVDDLRSLNGQIEFLLRRALEEAGRPPRGPAGIEPTARSGPPPDLPTRPGRPGRAR